MTGTLKKTVLAATAALATFGAGPGLAQEAPAREQYVYVLQVAPQFQQESSWTDAENAVVSRHFERLAQAAKSGQLILAGRTLEPLAATFGLVIFEAASEAAARAFMQSDPAVAAGLMTATLHPYAVALQRD
jgi:uncharacterized protein